MHDKVSVEIAKNAATNGRLFCLMIFAVNLVMFMNGYGEGYAALAALCAAPVGLSVLADHMPESNARSWFSLGIIAFTAVLGFITLFAAW